eukprot:TRINITY_DN2300_c0_g1_i2.p1 TRINITY_DN2300_c0_g1~~TRINITY_DN2300_c0_g1_i2.p1  ORF type:complete len:223 (-),score=12.00 TRINITY_DN2300_c0_g1_i2:16-684(-)
MYSAVSTQSTWELSKWNHQKDLIARKSISEVFPWRCPKKNSKKNSNSSALSAIQLSKEVLPSLLLKTRKMQTRPSKKETRSSFIMKSLPFNLLRRTSVGNQSGVDQVAVINVLFVEEQDIGQEIADIENDMRLIMDIEQIIIILILDLIIDITADLHRVVTPVTDTEAGLETTAGTSIIVVIRGLISRRKRVPEGQGKKRNQGSHRRMATGKVKSLQSSKSQ